MTLTIAARWRVTFRVQSLARVTYPPPDGGEAVRANARPARHRGGAAAAR